MYFHSTVRKERGGRYHRVGSTAYWARPDSEIPAISATMHTSRSYIMSVWENRISTAIDAPLAKGVMYLEGKLRM